MYDPSQLYQDPVLTNMSVGFKKMAKKSVEPESAAEDAKEVMEEAPMLPPQDKMMVPDANLPAHPSDGKHKPKAY